jgi:ATP-binding cassette subfamily B protein
MPSSPALPLPAGVSAAPAASKNVRSLSGLMPFLRPYRGRIALAVVFLIMAAVSTLVFPAALKSLIDQGLVATDPGERVMALREHFFALFAVGAALGVFSAARFYMVSWLGERVTADLRNAVYAHVVRQSPEFFETTQTGEVLSRLTTDTTLVQTVVGSSLSMGLRNTVMGIGAMLMLIIKPVCDDAGAGHPGAGGAAIAVLRAPRAQAVARQPGQGRRFERHRGRGAQCRAGSAELHAGDTRGRAFLNPPRARS